MFRSTVSLQPLRSPHPTLTHTRWLNLKSIYVISIPITTHRSYIYMNHNSSILDKNQLNKFPVVAKLESKLVSLATKGWDKMNSSTLSVNKRIIELVKKLLNTIPYEENCLKLFPSQSTMIREINEETTNKMQTRTLVPSQIATEQISKSQLKPIPFYHPSFQHPSTILSQLHDFRNDARSKHWKYAGFCAVGVPLSLPFALIPVIPNVPGLYLTYRLYCNIKALVGVNHLDYLLEKKNGSAEKDEVSDTDHIAFEKNLFMDSIYKLGNTLKELEVESVQEEERVIITKEIIDTLCNNLLLPQLKEDLLKALNQETKKLGKQMKINDEVE